MSEILEIIESSDLWAYHCQQDGGYRTDVERSRLSPEFGEVRSDPEGVDEPWRRTIGPYVLFANLIEEIEFGETVNGWISPDQLEQALGRSIRFFTKEAVRQNYVVLSRGILPELRQPFLSQYIMSQQPSPNGEAKSLCVSTILPGLREYETLLKYMRESPANARAVFDVAFPNLKSLCLLPGEANRDLMFFYDSPQSLEVIQHRLREQS